MNLCEAQWLAYVLPYRRFAAALTDPAHGSGPMLVRYSVIASDLHRLLVAGLPAHCERFRTSFYSFRRLIQWLRLLMLRILIVAKFAAQLKSA